MTPDEANVLQRAIDALSIEDVCVRSLEARLLPGFEPTIDADRDALAVSMKHLVRRFDVVALENGDDAEPSDR